MKLHFEPNLQFQLDAIGTVVRLFDGAPFVRPEDRIFAEVIANRLALSPEQVYANRDRIVGENRVTEPHKTDELDFTVEMETGTGKTYVYLRTIMELHKAYGLSKFIILVPSIAVKEGVFKTLEITQEHFKTLYNVNCHFFAFDSAKPNAIKSFAYSNTLEIMVMNIQAFNADDRIINQERDTNGGERLIDLLKATWPVVIMDEPQEGMGTENTKKRLDAFQPLFKLRYSATHKEIKNLVYQLTPFDAYNKRLVKTVEVLSVHEENRQSNVALTLKSVNLCLTGRPQPPKAKLEATHRQADGTFKEKTLIVSHGDDLEAETGNPAYNGWVVERIWKELSSGECRIRFANGSELREGERHGWEKETIFREQIRLAIFEHFKKKERLKPQGIKVLSLFFIDRVANYTEADGLIRRLFEEQYAAEYRKKYGKSAENVSVVHNGYFAKTGSGGFTDSAAAMGKNSEVFELIMRDKERLLSFEEPLEFVFSHSALGVGWDNPNVFQICTLNETESGIKKRQEIGRGLRICVNQEGNRVRDLDDADGADLINVLTVVPNQSYHAFVSTYQSELAEEYGDVGRRLKPRDARQKPTTVRLNKAKFESTDFDRLWERISKKTRYGVHFDEKAVIDQCVQALNDIKVPEHVIRIELNRIQRLDRQSDIADATMHVGSEEVEAAPPTVGVELAETLAEETWLSIGAVSAILDGLKSKEQVLKNPLVFMSEAAKRIKRILKDEMVRIVRYEPLEEAWPKSQFEELFETFKKVVASDKSIYDHVVCDSEVEGNFSIDANGDGKVRLYVKLPNWYEIDTPIGKYRPDWALAVEKRSLESGEAASFYFVVETKGGRERSGSGIDPDEWNKIQCAIQHFRAIGLEEYLAPVDSFDTFRQEANKKASASIF